MLPLGDDKKDRYAKLSFLGEGQVSNSLNMHFEYAHMLS